MSGRDRLGELCGWIGIAIGIALGAAAMHWWPIGVLALILGALGNILYIVIKESTP